MKKLFYCIVCAIAIGTLSSCDTFDSKKPNQEDNATPAATTVEGTPTQQKIEDKIAEQDTLRRVLASKVDTLSQKLSQENEELKTRTTKLESAKNIWSYMAFASLVIAIIALILSLVNLSKLKKVDKDRNKVADLAKEVELLELYFKQNVNKSFKELKAKVQELEKRPSEAKANVVQDKPKTAATNGQKQPPQVPKPEYPKVGYAKNDRDMYFTTIYDSNQEGCVFKIAFTGPNAGEFDIISLEKIQSRNDWQQKVECQGCSIKEARDFRVEEKGLCEKADESTWKVTRKLKIKLLK